MAAQSVGDIDRVLDRETIGRARPIRGGVGEAHRFAVQFGDEIGEAKIDRGAPPREHVL